MKKLNRKGFTLVELLAVIIILAIVVGITIPAVLTMVDNAKRKAGTDAADIVADWVDKQYGLISMGFGTDTVSSEFSSVCTSSNGYCTTADGVANSNAFIIAGGLKPDDVDEIRIHIDSTTGRSCITITPKETGNFYVNADGTSQTRTGGTCTSSSSSSSSSG